MFGKFRQQFGFVLFVALAVVQPEPDAGGDQRTDHRVDVGFGDFALRQQLLCRDILFPAARHLDVLTRKNQLLHVVDRIPVGHDQSFESEFAAQQVGNDLFALTRPLAVDAVVRGHYAGDACGDAGFEAGQVDLTHRAFVENRVRTAAVEFRVVGQEVFQAGGRAGTLHSLHVVLGDARREKRILAEILEIAAALRIAVDVQSGAEQYLDAARTALLADGSGVIVGQRRIERGGQHDRAWEGGGLFELPNHRGVGQVVAHVHALRSVRKVDVGDAEAFDAVEEEAAVTPRHRDFFVERHLR